MNISLPQKSPGRLPDLHPVDRSGNLSTPNAAPQVAKDDARKGKAPAQVGYGCVDWFQYHADAEEDNTAH